MRLGTKNKVLKPRIDKRHSKPFVSDKIVCRKSLLCNGIGVFTKRVINKGEKIVEFTGEPTSHSHYYTLQIGDNEHIGPSGGMDDYVNHSCNPNCYINFGDMTLIAIRKIKKGKELSFSYCTTDYDLGNSSFECKCGSKKCLGEVKGFVSLSRKEKVKMRPLLFPYLLNK